MALRVARYLVAVLALVPANAPAQTASNSRVYVDIVAVNDFADPHYEETSAGLGDTYLEAADKLRDFFLASVSSARVEIHSGKDRTSRAAIQRLLYKEIAGRRNSVNLLFILTHGHGEQYSGSNWASQELFLAASDTLHSDVHGTAVPASQLLDAITHFPASSSTFVFLDACYSGAAAMAGLELTTGLRERFGVNMMLLASSGAFNKSFSANFTKALIETWSSASESADCIDGDQRIGKALMTRMESIAGAAWPALRQQVTLVVPYQGMFCLDSISLHGALVLLRNPTATRFDVAYTRTDGSNPGETRVNPNSVLPLKLDRTEYRIVVKNPQNGAQVYSQVVDLGQHPITPLSVSLQAPLNSEVEASLLYQSALIAGQAGADDAAVGGFLAKAAGQYLLAGRIGDAVNALSRAQALQGLAPELRYALSAFVRPPTVNQLKLHVADNKLDDVKVAEAFLALSKFELSALYCDAISANADPQKKDSLQQCAYLGWTAANKSGMAAKVDTKSCPDCQIVAKIDTSKGAGGAKSGAATRMVMDKVKQY